MLLKPRQLAERLNVSLSTVYGLIETGKIACHRIGRGRGAVRVSEEDLADYLASCRNAEKNQTKPPRPRVKLKHLKL
ncbi:MAG: helix-turn-helix domain-containing protein [Planctomycetota bacterium]|nr:helix-turn-helix domain-containing protein [Planctomycetota bacterium]